MNNNNLVFTLEFLENIANEPVVIDAELLLEKYDFQLLWQGAGQAFYNVSTSKESKEIMLYFEKEEHEDWLSILVDREDADYIVACYIAYRDSYQEVQTTSIRGKIYERHGIIKRVLKERRKKAKKLEYKVKLNKNLYDEHYLQSEDGKVYKVTLWDLDNQLGYIDNIDWKTNKLATTKHIMFLCDYINDTPSRYKRLRKKKSFVELSLDPLEDYKLTWKYNQEIPESTMETIVSIFGKGRTHLMDEELIIKNQELNKLVLDPSFIIRSEVFEKISRYFDKQALDDKKVSLKEIDFSMINANLYPYQKTGAYFSLFRQSAIIADEMGLGKTIQAITAALLKKQYLGFKKTLIICPASVKYQWAAEIEKFTDEKVTVVSGKIVDRQSKYTQPNVYFTVVNYEMVMRDYVTINNADFDLIILDEAQRIKNFNTKTAAVMQGLLKQHGLVLTGTPIENKLIDIYSIILFLDKYQLTPLWEFSYQHCVFDFESEDRINGYFNLAKLKERLKNIVVRRQKHEVLTQLPNLSEKKYLIRLHPKQRAIHSQLKQSIAHILAKKFKTKFDWDRIMMALTQMRRVSNSTYLIQKNTFHSSKIKELTYILKHQLDIKNTKRKVIIFSEWLDSLYLIERVLDEIGVKYTKLTGSIPTDKRGRIVDTFMTNEDCKVFLSTEAGGSGLNLQIADTVINFELPWNPARKSQRIGRINRIGQKNKNLLVVDLICEDSIEMRIASGLALKQNLFDGVLDIDKEIDTVDFTEEGRAQFMQELKTYVDEEEILDPMEANTSSFEELFDEDDMDVEVEGEAVFDVENIEFDTDALDDELDWGHYLSDVLDSGDEDVILEGASADKEVPLNSNDQSQPNGAKIEPSSPSNNTNSEVGSNGSSGKTERSNITVEEQEQMEDVLNKGLDFLAGLYQMSTGKKIMDESNDKNISIDKETGEVVLRFKLK